MILKKKKILLAKSLAGGGVSAYQSLIISEGPIAYWPLDEVTGSTAKDRVGIRDGTITSGVLLDRVGVNGSKAMFFSGLGKISLPVIDIPLFGAFECWVKHSLTTEQYFPIFSNRNGDSTGTVKSVLIGATTDTNFPGCFSQHQTPNLFKATTTVGGGQWHHLVLSFTDTTLTAIIDGVIAGSGSALRTASVTPPRNGNIGFDSEASKYLVGDLQDIAIYDRALNQSTALAHFNGR